MAEVDQVRRLGVDEGLEASPSLSNLVVVNGEMGVELASDALELAVR